jgi:hypothetical protein
MQRHSGWQAQTPMSIETLFNLKITGTLGLHFIHICSNIQAKCEIFALLTLKISLI